MRRTAEQITISAAIAAENEAFLHVVWFCVKGSQNSSTVVQMYLYSYRGFFCDGDKNQDQQLIYRITKVKVQTDNTEDSKNIGEFSGDKQLNSELNQPN